MVAARTYVILCGAWRRRWTVVAPMLILPLIAGTIGFLLPKSYQAHTSILLQETAKMNPVLGDLAVDSSIQTRMKSIETLLHSRHILKALAEDLEMIGAETNPAVVDQVINQLSEQVSVSLKGENLLTFEVKGPSPERMEDLLKFVSARFLEELLAPERSSLSDASYFLSEHLKAKREALQKAENDLAQYRLDHKDSLPETLAGNLANLNRLQERLAQVKLAQKSAQARVGNLAQQVNQTDPVLSELESNIVRVRGQLALLTSRYTESHSEVRSLKRQLSRLEAERNQAMAMPVADTNAADLWSLAIADSDGVQRPLLVMQMDRLQSLNNEVAGFQDERAMLEGLISELEDKTTKANQHQQKLSELERDLEVKNDIYLELLKRFEMTRISGSLGTFERDKRVRVIDAPFTPTAPTNFAWWIFALAGIFGGLGLGAGVAVILEILDGSVRTRAQIESISGVELIDRAIW